MIHEAVVDFNGQTSSSAMTSTNDQPPTFEEVERTISAPSQTPSAPSTAGARLFPFQNLSFGTNTGSDSSVLSADVFGRSHSNSNNHSTPHLRSLPEDEEPPDYDHDLDPANLPDYVERHLQEPVVSYNIFQITRKLAVLTPTTRSQSHRPRYRIVGKSGMFSKKADFTLIRLPTGTQAAAESTPGKEVGFITFDKGTKIPWMPRATVKVAIGEPGDGSGKLVEYPMEAPNFSDWKFKFHGEAYFWRLTDKPTALSLFELGSESVLARFTYSIHGTDATRGNEVGTLDIFGGSRSEDLETVETLLSTCHVPLMHWKNMGRHYRNDSASLNRNCSVSGGAWLRNSVSVGLSVGLAPTVSRDGSVRTTRANSAVEPSTLSHRRESTRGDLWATVG